MYGIKFAHNQIVELTLKNFYRGRPSHVGKDIFYRTKLLVLKMENNITTIYSYFYTLFCDLMKMGAVYFIIINFLFQASFPDTPAFAKNHKAIVVQSQALDAYSEAVRGFEQGCKEKGIEINAIYNMKGDANEGKSVIKNIKDKKFRPDIIFAVGILATTLIKEQFTDIPIIFCMVINHERFNLKGSNITGIAAEASVEYQFNVLREIIGAQKNVGVVYDPMKTEKIVSAAVLVAKRLEFNFIKTPVASEEDVVSALNRMIDKIDVLWIIPDGTVVTKESLEYILKTSQKLQLPVFCTSSALVKAGALISISPDYRQTGLQAAQLAQTLLNSPTVLSLGIKQPDKLKITVNTQTAKNISMDMSLLRLQPNVVLYP